MKINSLAKTTSFAGIAVAAMLVSSANAQTVTIALPDIGTFDGYTDGNTSDTFTGTGFLGIYPTFNNDLGAQGPDFAHLFGLEYYNGIFSETELQASLAGLPAGTITSAYLNFSMLNGNTGNESVNVTSFTANGTLGYNESAPNDLGSVTGTGITGGADSINVTSLVQAAVGANQSYLGLFLQPQGSGYNYLFTYTDSGDDAGPDSANASLVINYGTAVPDGASTASLLSIALSGLAFVRNRRK